MARGFLGVIESPNRWVGGVTGKLPVKLEHVHQIAEAPRAREGLTFGVRGCNAHLHPFDPPLVDPRESRVEERGAEVMIVQADVTDLDDQQRVWDQVMGKVAPTLKPFVDATSVEEEGVAPHSKLQRGGHDGLGRSKRGRGKGSGAGGGRTSSGPSRKGSRGDR